MAQRNRRLTIAPEYRTPPVFEVCVHGRPVSAQASKRPALQAWKRLIGDSCKAVWTGKQPIEVGVIIRVTHYCTTMIGDVDNLTKPIQDALQGIVYVDDKQVRDVTGNRRNIDGRFRVRHMSLPLAAAFSDGRQFVHIRVWPSSKLEDLG